MEYKRIIPGIFIAKGKAVKWFDDFTVLSDTVLDLAKDYADKGADEILVFDLSDTEEERGIALEIIRQMDRIVKIPITVVGRFEELDDIKKILYSGAGRVVFDYTESGDYKLVEEAYKRFGKNKIAVMLKDFDALFKNLKKVEKFTTGIMFRDKIDLNSVENVTDIPSVILTEALDEDELFLILSFGTVKGVTGRFINDLLLDYHAFKQKCSEQDIQMNAFTSTMDFSQFKLNDQGLIPVVVQHYKTNEVLMVAYMNEESYNLTIKTGLMTYYSRSRQQLWLKGETSGHFQHVKSLIIDCDYDTILAKVDQIGAACHTGNPTCFFQPLAGKDIDEDDPHKLFEILYKNMKASKDNPKEKDYPGYMFGEGLTRILKKVGEESTEVLLSGKDSNKKLQKDISGLIYHLMLLMVEKGIDWNDIIQELDDITF